MLYTQKRFYAKDEIIKSYDLHPIKNVNSEPKSKWKKYAKINPNRETSNGGVKEFIANNWHETFFKKTTDWQYEQEFRIVKRAKSANDEYLDIKGCIDCVIINRAKDISHNDSVFKSSQYIALTKIYHQEYIYEYGVSLDGYKALSGYGRENFIWSEKGDGWEIDLTDQ